MQRRFGKDLKARKYWFQVKEIKVKIIFHNLTKVIQSVVIVTIGEAFRQNKNRNFINQNYRILA